MGVGDGGGVWRGSAAGRLLRVVAGRLRSAARAAVVVAAAANAAAAHQRNFRIKYVEI